MGVDASLRSLRVAIIGAGMIGEVHLRAARAAGATVIGVLASSEPRSVDVAEAWGVARGYASIEELLEERPDVVHVCTPNDTHHAFAMAAILAGRNVICEKPLAVSSRQAGELARAARDANVIATVPFVYRYHPLIREIRARRAAGEFGELNLLHGSYLQDWLLNPESSSWRVDASTGGPSRAFADIGSHWCDLVEFVSGQRFASVSAVTAIAYTTRPAPNGPSFSTVTADPKDRVDVTTEDGAIATFRTSDGIPANVVVSQIAGGRKNRLWFEIDGSRGSAVFDQENPESIWLGTESGAQVLRRGEGTPSDDQQRLNRVPAGHPQGYPDAFESFVADSYAAVNGHHVEGLPTFEDGLRSARIVDAVLESAATASWTDIPNNG
jgi:predicted dehydrogenase